jgi:divalent metal cation (Fe/Co/Zn/Cd) transporter
VGLFLTHLTGWLPFDPICAIIVALNILWSGFELMKRSIGGLMDSADPETDMAVRAVLDEETAKHGIIFHELKHRNAGRTTWIEVHLLFPDETHLKKAHRQATEIERVVTDRLGPDVQIITHLEPRVDHERIHHHPAISESSAR